LPFFRGVNSGKTDFVLRAGRIEDSDGVAVADPDNVALDCLRVSGDSKCQRYNSDTEVSDEQQNL
jgi:hypothetical protein